MGLLSLKNIYNLYQIFIILIIGKYSFFGVDKDNNLEINIKLALRIFPYFKLKQKKMY